MIRVFYKTKGGMVNKTVKEKKEMLQFFAIVAIRHLGQFKQDVFKKNNIEDLKKEVKIMEKKLKEMKGMLLSVEIDK